MIAFGADRSAAENLVETYFELGAATPGSQLIQDEGFRACTGPFEHPICNFAANLKLTLNASMRLQELAISRPSFNVYSLPGDWPAETSSLLQSQGFRPSHSLCLMACEPRKGGNAILPIEAKSSLERARVARFMAEQFFSRQRATFRKRVEETTCAAENLSLFSIESKGKIFAAAMISDKAGVFGLYNLCVASAHRGCGWGSELLQSMLNLAAQRQKLLTLQCEVALENWYIKRGFNAVGTVQIHSLPKAYTLDIMEQL